MRLSGFNIFVLVLTLATYQAYSIFAFHFSGLEQVKHELKTLHGEMEREQLRTQLAQSQTLELEQSVASIAPEILKKTHDQKQQYGLRTLASVASASTGVPVHLELASGLFEKGREFFRSQKFSSANDYFSQVIDGHPLSPHVIESYFLFVEGAYQIHDYAKVVRMVEAMMTRYPEHVLTGFALIRLARIFAENERVDDAKDVLQTILRTYDDKDLRTQVEAMLKAAGT